jgi:uncharacterized Zn finger protein
MSEIEINCPYCGEINYSNSYLTEGKSQEFIYDCEVCCRPIEIKVSQDKDGNVSIEVRNDDGF